MTTILKTLEILVKKTIGNSNSYKTTQYQERFLKQYDNDEETILFI